MPRALLLSALLLPALAAAAPTAIRYQGRLLDPTGAPVSGPVSLTVSLHDAPTGGTTLWTDTFAVVLQDGTFAVDLGSGLALDEGLFDGAALWIGAATASATLSPRQPIRAVPYAIHALNAGATDRRAPIVHRLGVDFAGATLDDLLLSDNTDHVAIRGLALDVGDGSDGHLVLSSGVHVDDGSPKQYASVTLTGTARVEVAPWNGSSGGRLDWRVKSGVFVASGAAIDVTGAGYRGGAGGETANGSTGWDGESPSGLGNGDPYANGGGGGGGPGVNASGGGGGGGYGTAGENGFVGSSGHPGYGGGTYGDAQLTVLHLGAGGGGGSLDNNGQPSRVTGYGGDGGGAIRIVAGSITVEGAIRADGAAGENTRCTGGSCAGSDDGGAGGGSGGSLHLRAADIAITGQVTARGGAHGLGNHDGNTAPGGSAQDYSGGAGGNGRIRLDFVNLSGTSTPAPGFAEDLGADGAGGVLTSAIVDTGAAGNRWGALTWDNTGGGLVLAKVRTGDDPALADAVAWSAAPHVANGQPLIGVSSVVEGHRYLQYRLELRPEAGVSPVIRSVVIARD